MDFANSVWNPRGLKVVVLHNSLDFLPSRDYISVSTGVAADIVTDMDPMALVNMVKPELYVSSETDVFPFCKQIGVVTLLVDRPVSELVKVELGKLVKNLKEKQNE